jgi:hypothetical protein
MEMRDMEMRDRRCGTDEITPKWKDLWSKICGQDLWSDGTEICGQRFVVRWDWNFARSVNRPPPFLSFSLTGES